MKVEKRKKPKHLSYVLKTSLLERVLREADIKIDTHLIYWIPESGGSPAFVNWLTFLTTLPDGSTLLNEKPYFNASYIERDLKIETSAPNNRLQGMAHRPRCP